MALGTRTVIAYALPAFALAVPTIPVYVFLPAFYAGTVGLGLTATGAALLAARLFDGISDPLIGWLSDRIGTRWGRRKPWILAGGVLAGIALLFLLQPPERAGFAYLLGWAIVLYAGWTLVSVPYVALGAELAEGYHERSRVTGAREMLTLVGILAAATIPPAAATVGATEAAGLAVVAWFAVAAGLPAFALLLLRVPDPATSRGTHRWMAFGPGLRAVVANGLFRRLLAAWFVNGLANGLPAVLFPLYLDHVLGVGAGVQGMLIGAYFLAGALAIPLWLRASRRWGKHRTWCVAMALACGAFVWVPALPHLPVDATVAFAVICVLTGVALGADLALPPAMQADVVDVDTLRTGERRAGLFFAAWSMATKAALALAVGIAFPVLDGLGFDPGTANTESALFALTVIYALVPCVLKAIAIAMMWGHPLSERRHRAVLHRIEARLRRLDTGIADGSNAA